MVKPIVLVTGAQGLLGPYLVQALRDQATVVTTSRRGSDRPCDLLDPEAVRTLLAEVQPQHVIHAAAMTNVDQCEVDPTAANAGNCQTTAHLAESMPRGCRLLYVSTDQVYPDAAGPHVEGTEAPINAYGRSKLAGERSALGHPGALVARTNLFGPSITPGRASLSDFVASSLAAGKQITLFRDVLFSPLHIATLAALLAEMTLTGLSGVFNVGSRDGLSKADFGLAVARRLGLSTDSVRIGLSSEMASRAPRTLDLRLSVARVEAALGRSMPTCEQEISRL
jgi:dTDP-4-dehydrorhamnose reductase